MPAIRCYARFISSPRSLFDGAVAHYRINQNPDGSCFIRAKQLFGSIPELIEHHTQNTSGLPVSKDGWVRGGGWWWWWGGGLHGEEVVYSLSTLVPVRMDGPHRHCRCGDIMTHPML